MPNPHPGYYQLDSARAVLGARLAAIERAVPAGSAILDLGCNDGRISRHLLETGIALRAHGVDVCEIAVAMPAGFTFTRADVASYDPDGLEPVDVILLLNVLHHVVADSREAAKALVARLGRISTRILCDMGSFSEHGDWSWRRKFELYWQSDAQMWDDLFESADSRSALLRYAAQTGGHRILWQLECRGRRA